MELMDSEDRQALEEFLQELVLQVDQPEAVDVLLGILRELKDNSVEPSHMGPSHIDRAEILLDRYDIFRMEADRIVRVGFVRGAENAKKVMPSLNSLGDDLYFLYETDGI